MACTSSRLFSPKRFSSESWTENTLFVSIAPETAPLIQVPCVLSPRTDVAHMAASVARNPIQEWTVKCFRLNLPFLRWRMNVCCVRAVMSCILSCMALFKGKWPKANCSFASGPVCHSGGRLNSAGKAPGASFAVLKRHVYDSHVHSFHRLLALSVFRLLCK